MSISQNFVPTETIVETGTFYSGSGIELRITEMRIHDYMNRFYSQLEKYDINFTQEDFRSFKTATSLIDALSKTRISAGDSSDYQTLEQGHHVFNIFYKAPNSHEWVLQFANSAYLEKLGANLSDKMQATEIELMQCLYTPETIQSFTSAAEKSRGGYKARFIEMDNVVVHEDEDVPAFFWYRKDFSHPNGGEIQVRIGMNGTGLLPEQKAELADIYRLADILREQNIKRVHYNRTSYEELGVRIREEIVILLKTDMEEKKSLVLPLRQISMMIEIADDIIKNSPFPLTIVDEKGIVEHISPAYAATVGYAVDEILKPGFFKRIYPRLEGKTVEDNMAHYKKNGNYPPGETFFLSRGNVFLKEESENNLLIGSSEEIIPSLHPIGQNVIGGVFMNEGTVRLNTVRPIEESVRILGDSAGKVQCHFESDAGVNKTDFGTESSINNALDWLNDFNSKP